MALMNSQNPTNPTQHISTPPGHPAVYKSSKCSGYYILCIYIYIYIYIVFLVPGLSDMLHTHSYEATMDEDTQSSVHEMSAWLWVDGPLTQREVTSLIYARGY